MQNSGGPGTEGREKDDNQRLRDRPYGWSAGPLPDRLAAGRSARFRLFSMKNSKLYSFRFR